MRVTRSLGFRSLLFATTLVHAIELDVSSPDSILSASKTIVQDILNIYGQPQIPGLFPDDYYWWESGLAFDSLIKYYSASGDASIVQTVQDGLLWQSNAPDYNFMPANQSKSLGNDDQAFWGLAAMTAAETGFPLRSDQNATWLQLAENVFNSQALRWNTATCNGGLKWQIFAFNSGYNYKNSASNGAFAYLAARLARYTGNTTYSDWAQKAAQWEMDVGLISDAYAVYDGTADTTNCSTINHIEWTQNYGLFIGAAAYAANATSASYWSDMTSPFVNRTDSVFTKSNDNVLYEVACAPSDNCNIDQLAFRATLARALGNINELGTSNDMVTAILQASAQGAAAQCSGGSNGTTCGSDWTSSKWDGTKGLGQDLSALEIIMANLPLKQMDSANNTSGATVGLNGTTTSAENGTSSDSPSSPTQTGGAAMLSSFGSVGLVGIIVSLLVF